jgi:hypothetical protein
MASQLNIKRELPSLGPVTYSRAISAKYDSGHYADVDMRMEDDVDAACSIDLDGDTAMERDCHHAREKYEDDEDEEENDWEEEDEDEVEDEDQDDGKEPWTIGHREMVNTSADDINTAVDNQPIVLPDQGQQMIQYTPQPQPPARAPWPRTPEFPA